MIASDRVLLDGLIRQWEKRGLNACPNVQPPIQGWNAIESSSRIVGAVLLECAEELRAVLLVLGEARPQEP